MDEQPKRRFFYKEDESSLILCSWWGDLEKNRGERATLRRASGVLEIVFSPAYHRLLLQLQQRGYKVNREALAIVVGLAAHVKENSGEGKTFAKEMAAKKPNSKDDAVVSDLRFRRLLVIKERSELYPFLIRVIRLINNKTNLVSLANSVYWWNETTRKQWAYDYYADAPKEK